MEVSNVNKNKISFIGVALLLSVAAYADTTPSANCSPFPATVNNGVGTTSVSCPAFSVPGATLTSVTLGYQSDFQFGDCPGAPTMPVCSAGHDTITVTFTPAGPGGVTWSPSSVPTTVMNGVNSVSSGAPGSGSATATAGVTTAAFASPFTVSIASAVNSGTVATSSGAVSVVYTYTPPPALTLSCPGTNSGTIGTTFSTSLVAAGGVPPYGPYAITGGSISPLTLNPSTGVISGTLPGSPVTITFSASVTDSASTVATTGPTTCVITVTLPSAPPPGVCSASTPVFGDGAPAGSFLIRYAANLNIGDSFIDITNAGTTVDPTTGASSNLCVNVFTFDTQEELISCCACLVTPNALQSISVQNSLINNPLTPAVPSAAVVKLVASVPVTGALAQGILAWGTTLHSNTSSSSSYGLTETPFSPSTLSRAELSHITSTCGFIQANGSKFGICGGCNGGGLGSASSSQ
jgi:hypothetical protein